MKLSNFIFVGTTLTIVTVLSLGSFNPVTNRNYAQDLFIPAVVTAQNTDDQIRLGEIQSNLQIQIDSNNQIPDDEDVSSNTTDTALESNSNTEADLKLLSSLADLIEKRAGLLERRAEMQSELQAQYQISNTVNTSNLPNETRVGIQNRIEQINEAYEQRLDQATTIYLKLESRLAKLNQDNPAINIDEARESLARSYLLLEQAGSDVIRANVQAAVVTAGIRTSDRWTQVKTSYEKSRESLIELKQALQETYQLTLDASTQSTDSEADNQLEDTTSNNSLDF